MYPSPNRSIKKVGGKATHICVALPPFSLFRRFQHRFDGNSISFGCIQKQHMGHCAHQIAVLQNRDATHE